MASRWGSDNPWRGVALLAEVLSSSRLLSTAGELTGTECGLALLQTCSAATVHNAPPQCMILCSC